MRFKKLTRLYNRIRFRSSVYVNGDSSWSVAKSATVRGCLVKLSGGSELRIGAGAIVKGVSFQIAGGSRVSIEEGASLKAMAICVWNGSDLVFGKEGQFRQVDFSVEKGNVHVGDYNCFDFGTSTLKPCVSIMDGSLETGDHNRIRGSVWVRFGGKVSIGKYNCINEQTEIRADESVRIGSYNMVSYCCDIWDTNTHSPYSLEEKKILFEKDFPGIGKERKRPKTAAVMIGDGNWIGKYACILKGVTLKDNVTVGTRAIVSNMVVEDGGVVVSPKGNRV